ncbi:MAG: TolC family protein [Methyloligellaceae bacterium]
MRQAYKTAFLIICLPAFTGGCMTINPKQGFSDVAETVKVRIGKRVHWQLEAEEKRAAQADLKTLLARPLTPSRAVQIALLNNRDLQATYADLGIAQAAVVQARLVKNPVLDGAVTWFNDAGGTPNLAFGVAWNFIDLLQRPLRKAVAESEFEEAKYRVARRVIALAADTHAAFIDYVANAQEVELFSQVVRSARATAKAAEALRKAGNITALQFDQQQSFLTRAKLEIAQAEGRQTEARERLNVLMGLTGAETKWRAPKRLPDVPAHRLNTRNMERRAVQHSLEIAAVRQRLITLGRRFRLVKKQSLIPNLEVGAEFEREVEVEDGEKNLREAFGPTFELEIPIFDRGQARRAGAAFQIKKAEDELWALAVRVRSAARLARARLLMTRKTAAYYSSTILPESRRILTGTQRDYNAMQQSIFQLVTAKRQQILAGREFIQARRGYWAAHVRFQQILSGALPEGGGGETMEVASPGNGGADEGEH